MIEHMLCRICGYEKTQRFFKTHPLHQFFQKKGGEFTKAIENALKSEQSLNNGERDYTYSEIGSMFQELDIIGPGVGQRGIQFERVEVAKLE